MLENMQQMVSNQRREAQQQLQEDAAIPLPLMTYLFGIALVIFVSDRVAEPWKINLISLVCIFSSLLAYVVGREIPVRVIGTISAGWTIAIGFGILWFPSAPVVFLLVLPIALSALFIERRLGLGACAVLSLGGAFVYRFSANTELALSWIIAVLVSWILLGMVWLFVHAEEEAILWYWQNYFESRQQLEEARMHQGELNQVVKDLADANTQLARLNKLLDFERQRAEEAERVKVEFTANVSHELRTPLNMIIGFSEAILNIPTTYGTRLPPALLADIAAIHRNSQHLTNMINDVLDISQVEARRMTLNRDWYSIAEIIQEAVQAVQPFIESRGLSINIKLESEISPIYCDRTRIRQVLLNLLSNAGRYSEKGGISIAACKDENGVTVTVTDTGPGINEADLPKLFEPFRQLDRSSGRWQGSSGLGLNISKRFVELHEGQMGVESQPGVGSSFWFHLPVKTGSPPTSGFGRWIKTSWEPRPHSGLTPKPVLIPRLIILEPSNLLEDMARRYLDDVQIEGVSSPLEVNSRLAEQPAQVVIVRGESQEQLSDWIRDIRTVRFRVPMITLSSSTRRIEDSLGVAGYLLKPVTSQQLVQSVGNLGQNIRSILLVDDNLEALQLFTRTLSSRPYSYRVLQANSGQEALVLLRKRKPDLIILDLVMPGMDGYQVLTEKNRDPEIQRIPVLVLSATDPNGQPVLTHSFGVIQQEGISITGLLQCALTLSGDLLSGIKNDA